MTMLDYEFMRTAFAACGVVGLIAGVVGYFLVLRGQTFAGHALSHVGFTGATGALLLGLSPMAGLFSLTVAAGIGMGFLGERLAARDVAIELILRSPWTWPVLPAFFLVKCGPGNGAAVRQCACGQPQGIVGACSFKRLLPCPHRAHCTTTAIFQPAARTRGSQGGQRAGVVGGVHGSNRSCNGGLSANRGSVAGLHTHGGTSSVGPIVDIACAAGPCTCSSSGGG